MRLLKAAFMLIILVDIAIILFALILLNPLLVLLFIAISGLLKGIHNQLISKQKLNKFYKFKSIRVKNLLKN
jgi:hypothetical protein